MSNQTFLTMKSTKLLFFILFSWGSFAQVGINTTTPNAQLEVQASNQVTPSNTDGILIPKVDAFPATNPTVAQNGMLVYLTTPSGSNQAGFYYWDNDSTVWVGINSSKTGWSVNGNSGMVSGTNFIGTKDANDLDVRANNVLRARFTQKGQIETFNTGKSVFIGEGAGAVDDLTNNENSFVGYLSGNSNVFSFYNTALGASTLKSNTFGDWNTAIGWNSLLLNEDGDWNTGLGTLSLSSNTSGYANTAVGTQSLTSNQSGSHNTSIGYQSMNDNVNGTYNFGAGDLALYHNESGNYNVAIGPFSLMNNIGNSRSTAVGYYSMYNANNRNSSSLPYDTYSTALGYEALKGSTTPSLNTGIRNTAIGDSALLSNVNGAYCVAVGDNSLRDNTSGGLNVAVGSSAMYKNITGYWNVAVGAQALLFNTAGIENTAIGYSALALNSIGCNNVAIGKMSAYNNSGSKNIAIGDYSLHNNNANSGNIAIGYYSMMNADNNSIGSLTYNTALGFESLFGSLTAGNNTGTLNTSIGALTLRNNSTGTSNVAIGYRSLFTNSTGNYNVSNGKEALFTNSTGSSNLASGYQALFSNSTGSYNVANGFGALLLNNIGAHNTAVGSEAMTYNTIGDYNTAVGKQALYSNQDGGYNAAVGAISLAGITNGILNTAVGDAAYSTGNYSNSTAVGYNTFIGGSNLIRLGNTSVTGIGGFASWSNLSDARFKKNVKENVPGIDFILKLRPVTYTLDVNQLAQALKEDFRIDSKGNRVAVEPNPFMIKSRNEKSKINYTGFLAQEVEQAAQEIGYDFSGVDKPKNENDFYALRYAEFVVPLVKAIQEQQQIIESEKAKNSTLESEIKTLKDNQEKIEARLKLLESK